MRKEEGENIQSGSAEESSSSVIPPVDDLGRIPIECTVDCLTCRSDHYPSAPSLKRWIELTNTNEGERPVDEGDEKHLPVCVGSLVCVSSKIGLGLSIASR